MTFPMALLAALALSGNLAKSESHEPAPSEMPAAVISSSRQFEIHSKVNGQTYLVKVAIPQLPAPRSGFPVLYVLDGDAFFGTFTEAVRERAGAGEISPAIVVGITYSQEATAQLKRLYDFTPTPPSEYEKANIPEIPADAAYGGAEAFYNVLEREIIPRVSSIAPVDTSKRLLFGWSLGGLFVLYTMFNHPAAFHGYVALSPSIWMGGSAVLQNERVFAKAVTTRRVAPRVFLGVGAQEQSVAKDKLPPGFSVEKALAVTAYASMIGNVERLATRLQALPGSADYQVKYSAFAGQTHNSEPWAAINPVLDFLFSPEEKLKH